MNYLVAKKENEGHTVRRLLLHVVRIVFLPDVKLKAFVAQKVRRGLLTIVFCFGRPSDSLKESSSYGTRPEIISTRNLGLDQRIHRS